MKGVHWGWNFFFIFTVCGSSFIAETTRTHKGINEEDRLWKFLIQDSGYNPRARPVLNVSGAVNITMDIAIHQIIEFDEPRMDLKSDTWIRLYWRDDLLKWNTSEYSGLTSLAIKASDIWLPDLTLYSSTVNQQNGVVGNSDVFLTAYHNGNVTWLFRSVHESRCSVDMAMFPFDTQHCDHQFGSWSLDGTKLDLYPQYSVGDTSNFIDSGEWVLLEAPSFRKIKQYKCCSAPFPSVIYTYVLKRRPMYYFVNMMVPCFVITVVSLFSFLLPVESGERITFVITTFLALVVFFTMVAEHIPPQGGVVPVILWYFGLCILILCLGTIEGVVVYLMHAAGEYHRPFPAIARVFTSGCFSDMLISDKFRSKKPQRQEWKGSKMVKVERSDKHKLSLSSESMAVFPHYLENSQSANNTPGQQKSDFTTHAVPDKMEFRSNPSTEEEWMQLANAMDKFFFVWFLLVTISVSVYVVSLF